MREEIPLVGLRLRPRTLTDDHGRVGDEVIRQGGRRPPETPVLHGLGSAQAQDQRVSPRHGLRLDGATGTQARGGHADALYRHSVVLQQAVPCSDRGEPPRLPRPQRRPQEMAEEEALSRVPWGKRSGYQVVSMAAPGLPTRHSIWLVAKKQGGLAAEPGGWRAASAAGSPVCHGQEPWPRAPEHVGGRGHPGNGSEPFQFGMLEAGVTACPGRPAP